MSDNLEAGSSS